MAAAAKPWRVSKTGLVVQVRLTPKASRDAVRGLNATEDGPRLAVSVRAVPDKGEANAALLVVVAKWLGMPKSRLSLNSGAKSREKSVAIEGDPAVVANLIERKLQSGD